MPAAGAAASPGPASGGVLAAETAAGGQGPRDGEILQVVIESVFALLPWDSLGAAASPACRAWRDVAAEPRVWHLKHQQHFGCAPAAPLPGPTGAPEPEPGGAKLAFERLREVQVRALRGDELDVVGTWVGLDENQCGGVFHFRLTVRAGDAGRALWRGAPADAPFHHQWGTACPEEALDALMTWPARLRSLAAVRSSLEAVNLSGSAEEACQHRGFQPTDEVEVGGHIEWFVSRRTDRSLLARMEATARFRDGVGMAPVVERPCKEFVSGVYSPSARRLILAGTHKSHSGVGIIGLDSYDIQVDDGGLKVSGVSAGDPTAAGGSWLNELTGQARVLLGGQDWLRAVADVQGPPPARPHAGNA